MSRPGCRSMKSPMKRSGRLFLVRNFAFSVILLWVRFDRDREPGREHVWEVR